MTDQLHQFHQQLQDRPNVQTLPCLAQPFKLGKKTAALQRELNQQIESLNAEIEKHNAALATLANANADELLSDLDERAEDLRRENLRLLGDEFKLRQQLIGYFQAAEADKSAALTRAAEEEATTREEVTARLLDAGFELIQHPTFGRCIKPEVMFLHPRMIACRQEVTHLQHLQIEHATINRERLEKINSEAMAIRSKTVALAVR